MQRIQQALQEQRCVLLFGDGLVGTAVEEELNKKNISAVSLTEEVSTLIKRFSAEALTPAADGQGMLVLVEPDFDEVHLEALTTFIESQNPRPQLFLIAKFYNKFAMPMSLMSLKFTHIKSNAVGFLRSLTPIEAQPTTPVVATQPQNQSLSINFVGRETEVQQVSELLNTAGTPVCLKGIEGIGKRALIEHVIAQNEWTRVPELRINQHLNGDAFLGRLAQLFASAGNDALLKGLSGKKRISIDQTLKLVAEGLSLDGLANHCFVVSGLQNILQHGEFASVGLFEMVLETVWKTETSLKIAFLTSQLPSAGSVLRTVELNGLSASDADAFLKMWQAPEFGEEELNTIVTRTHGHPLALRYVAIKAAASGDYSNLSNERFAAMSSAHDFQQIRKIYGKLTQKLDKEEQEALNTIAVYNTAVSAHDLTARGINRKMRAALIAKGVLEQTMSKTYHRYYASDLIHSVSKNETIYNYDTMETIAEVLMEKSKDASPRFNKSNPEPLWETAYLQEANALFWAARKRKRVWRAPLPCVDIIVGTATELLSRGPNKKVDFAHIAELQIKDGLQQAPNHPELLLLEIKRALKDNGKRKKIASMIEERRANAFTPKFAETEADFFISSRQPEKAIKVLQDAVEKFDGVADLWSKLAELLNKQGHTAAALQTVEKAIELNASSPTNFSLKGEILSGMGTEHLEAASEALSTANSLYRGNNPVNHVLRQVDLLQTRAMLTPDNKDALLTEAQALLESSIQQDGKNNRLKVAMAGVLLEMNSEDYEQITGLLKPALGRRDNSDAHLYQARLLIRKGELIDVQGHLDQAFKLSRNNSAINTVRGEYYILSGQYTLALKAFQSALDASAEGSPEQAQARLHVEQITAIVASQANVNYAEIGEESINVVPLNDPSESKPTPMIRRRKKKSDSEG